MPKTEKNIFVKLAPKLIIFIIFSDKPGESSIQSVNFEIWPQVGLDFPHNAGENADNESAYNESHM